MSKYNKLQGTRVLVIGGTSGIGYAVAEGALESGATVIISSSNQAKIDAAVASLDAHAAAVGLRPAASGKACDLGDQATVEANLDALLDFATNNKADKLNHVAFTAGDSLAMVPIASATPAVVSSMLNVRVVASLMLAKRLPEYTVRSNRTSYTITGGSIAARPPPGTSVVAGFGAAIEGFARGLAVDLKPIRVNAVQPGAVRTPLLGDNKEFIEMFAKDSITGTVGRPEEVAEAYLYLMKDSFTTATVVESNGGRNYGQSQEISEFN